MTSTFIVLFICAGVFGLTYGETSSPTGNTLSSVIASVNGTACYQQMAWPEVLILNPYFFNNLGPICNTTYLRDCDQNFTANCLSKSSTCTNQTNYMEWMNAYYNGSQSYICSSTLQNFKDNYDSDCIYNEFEPLYTAFYRLARVAYYGNTTNCDGMGKLFNDVLTALGDCDSNKLQVEFKAFYQAIVDVSPCSKQIMLSSTTQNHANLALMLVAILVALLYSGHQ